MGCRQSEYLLNVSDFQGRRFTKLTYSMCSTKGLRSGSVYCAQVLCQIIFASNQIKKNIARWLQLKSFKPFLDTVESLQLRNVVA